MYLTSFIHRDDLFEITERWLCGRLNQSDGLDITRILISDGFVLGETLEVMATLFLEMMHGGPCRQTAIHFKGELRDLICGSANGRNRRIQELLTLYRSNPEFFYPEAPINGVIYLNRQEKLLGLSRIKRPRRIAEKANRYVANWIFGRVRSRAQAMAEKRAWESGVPLERLITPRSEMELEFIRAEEAIAQQFREGAIRLDKAALTIHDVGGIKIIAAAERLAQFEKDLAAQPQIKIVARENFSGNYQATSLIIEVPWDHEHVCRSYMDGRGWQKYLNRGIEEGELEKGLAPLLEGAKPTLNLELILSTFSDMVESELGYSIHEERILTQRDNRIYRGYIPMNVEFLIEYLFAVGLGPCACIECLPIKLWGRYLPDSIIDRIRELYRIPRHELFP